MPLRTDHTPGLVTQGNHAADHLATNTQVNTNTTDIALLKPFNVKSYGATGNGVTNDYAAIQAASDAANTAGGGIVYFPPTLAYYICNGEVTVYPEVIYQGSGRASLIDSSTWSFSGYRAIFKSTNASNKTDFWFRDLYMKGMFTHGTSGTFATSPGQFGILVNNARRVLIENCYFEGFFDATVIGNNASTYDDSIGPANIKEVKFINNWCYRCVGGLQGQSMESITWIGNHGYQIADDLCAFLTTQGVGGSLKAVCMGNIMEDGRWLNNNGVPGVGVLIKADGSGVTGATAQMTVASNISRNAFTDVYLSGFSQGIVANNIFSGSNQTSILLAGTISNMTVIGNEVHNPNTSANSGHAGILGSGLTDVTISYNRVFGANNGQKQGISLEGSITRCHIDDNEIRNSDSFGIYAETATDSSISRNKLSGTFVNGVRFSGSDCMFRDNMFAGTFSSGRFATSGFTGIAKNNQGVNPDNLYAQGNITGATTFSRVNGAHVTATATGNVSLTIVDGIFPGDELCIEVTQDGTGGRTISKPANVKLVGVAFSPSAAAGAKDTWTVRWDGSFWVEVSRAINVS